MQLILHSNMCICPVSICAMQTVVGPVFTLVCCLSHSSIICVVVIIGGFSKTRLLNRFCAFLLHCSCYNGDGNNHLHLCAENCVDLSYFSVMVDDVVMYM